MFSQTAPFIVFFCCSYATNTDPADVARVESKTFIVTEKREDSVPEVEAGVKGILGQWMGMEQATVELAKRFPGSMIGNHMYVIPFSMGPLGSPLSRIGVQLTDFSYVVLSMRIMTRISPTIWDSIRVGEEYVKCVHSCGAPRGSETTRKLVNNWPCDPERILVTHFPDERLIMSYGSGYGGNSLLGKKCFALRIASRLAKEEGWLAEHMLIMSVTDPAGNEKFIAAAFPSACGKTNLAMLLPTLPGWKVQCIGDDIAWMRFDGDGQLRAINPEAGFFGVAPGTSIKSNPVAVETIQSNTIFTNVGITEDGGVFWEGMEKDVQNPSIKTWLGQEGWKIGDAGKAAHPNSRFCTPAAQCPIIHPKWQDPEGVPISAIIFGGRRPAGVPLVTEAFNWEHGVAMGAMLKSEATAAAEHKGKQIMHDPMAMRPFMGYNFGDYLKHWLSLAENADHQMPRVFHVNWFRLDDESKKFLWPGFGENIRVLEWICRRIDGEEGIVEQSPIGLLPTAGSINTSGLRDDVDMEQLLSVPRDYWLDDMQESASFLHQQVGRDLPAAIKQQVQQQIQRLYAYDMTTQQHSKTTRSTSPMKTEE